MKIHNSTYLRNNMREVIKSCVEDCEPVLITTNKKDADMQKVIIISNEQYEMMISQINGE